MVTRRGATQFNSVAKELLIVIVVAAKPRLPLGVAVRGVCLSSDVICVCVLFKR